MTPGWGGMGDTCDTIAMTELSRGCGGLLSLIAIVLSTRLVGAQDNFVTANVGKPMELTAPFLAVTPAAADPPSSGPGPVITGYLSSTIEWDRFIQTLQLPNSSKAGVY